MTDLNGVNERFILEISKTYNVAEVNNKDILMYKLTLRKQKKFGLRQLLKIEERDYLILCDGNHRVDDLLNSITAYEEHEKADTGGSYLCLMPVDKADADMCTQFNGKSFVHFIFVDNSTNKLVIDKDFYYSGAKRIKMLMDIYSDCFSEFSSGGNCA